MTKEELEARIGEEIIVSMPAPTPQDGNARVDQRARVRGVRGQGVDLIIIRQGRSVRVPLDWCRELKLVT